MHVSQKDIKNAIKTNKLVIGTKEVLKNLKRGKIVTVYYTTNCPDLVKKQAKYYSELAGVKIEQLEGNSQQLGELCGRPYKTVMVGIAK